MTRPRAALCLALALGLAAVAACGKKNEPIPPAGQESEYRYPLRYPQIPPRPPYTEAEAQTLRELQRDFAVFPLPSVGDRERITVIQSEPVQ